MHTPVSIYLKVRDMYPQSALMESSDYHAGENSLSFIALCPLASIGINGGIVTSNYPDNSRTEEPLTKTFHVEKAMNRFINQFQVTGDNKNVCGLYGYRIFGSSPETHCKIEDGRAYIDPIAGTTRRTGDVVKDRELTEALLADPKENAEHVMLVDLARNDLSRNCHDVRVLFYKEPQYYSHVIHLVSRVSGMLNEGADKIKTFIDTFPAGTLSGAPKVRAMQLISEIEPHNRGAYGGCIGFIGLNGELNQAITIRTFVSRNNELWFQAGGGIVARSQDEYELQEVNNKLGALKKAIDLAIKLKN